MILQRISVADGMRYLDFITTAYTISRVKHVSNRTRRGHHTVERTRSPRAHQESSPFTKKGATGGSSPYPDTRLPSRNSTIRLLQIDRHDKSSIAAQLGQISLDSKECPDFVTISYVWGESRPESRVNIVVNGIKFPVAPSISPILELIRDHADFKKIQWVWIDGICINQEDTIEKNVQVEMMGRIYSRYKMTVAWLGKAETDTAAAMEMLADLSHREKMLRKDRNDGKPRMPPADLRQPDKWRPLRRFFSMPWWKRVWTLQEFILARNLRFYWGDKSIDRRKLMGAVHAIWLCNPEDHLIPWEVWRPAWSRRRLYQWHMNRHESGKKSLLAWMAYNSAAELSDHRDRVYAVFDLAREEDRELVGKPNYEDDNTVAVLYRNLVTSWVQKHKSLDIICFSQLFNRHQRVGNAALAENWPSWVPNWTTPIDTFVVPLMVSQSGKMTMGSPRPLETQVQEEVAVYAASGDRAPVVRFTSDRNELPCEGVFIDTIDGLGGMTHTEEHVRSSLVQSTSPKNITPSGAAYDNNSLDPCHESSASKQLLDDIARCLVLDRKNRLLGPTAPINRFREDFQLLAAAAVRGHKLGHSPARKAFPRWFEHNKSLLIRGHTLEEWCKAMPIPTKEEKSTYDSPDSFATRALDTTGLYRMSLRLVTTYQGFVGMAPMRARDGDSVCVLYGCSVPVILRKHNHGNGAWELIGECYLHGFMNGEVLNSGRLTEEFTLL